MHNEKSLGTVVAETKEELKQFIQTRLAILKAELNEKVQIMKYSIPLLIVAAALLLGCWIILTFAFVALLHAWLIPGDFGWFWSALIVAGVYFLGGVIIGWFGYSELKSTGMAPNRTINVLKEDQIWIQNEARTA